MRFERIGSYDVTALIGEGGMGQVYQATDTKLNRQVALKILPEAFASDPDRLARFQREAQVLASLNHPNIAAIHGLEDREGTKALVLELVEGPTLADRIAQGAIPLDEALPIAKQIAEALEAAHEAGVIHRDLKPANIKVRDDGTVKVLDFGLAKALDTTPEGDPSQSPTLTAAATQMGVIMGTAAYMSPEQASGATADKRSDIWSFGVVLFEMLTGQRLFTGKTVAHVMAKVLDRDLDLTVLPTTTPAPIKRLLRRCLEREQKRRLRDVGEALSHLEEAATTPVEEPSVAASVTPVAQTAGWRQALPLALGLAVVAAVITGVAVWSVTRPEPPQLVRLTVALNEGPPFIGLESRDVAMSPDGEYIAYLTGGKWPQVLPDEQLLYTSCCPTQVWVVDLATGEQTSLLENAFFGRYSQTGHIILPEATLCLPLRSIRTGARLARQAQSSTRSSLATNGTPSMPSRILGHWSTSRVFPPSTGPWFELAETERLLRFL